ncbi:DNA primase [Melghirimyces profundicolus]|uniref:DNA primase n=1 Tax=Melghirimyces profundicolus TaxID=1242148 RepID=A0A2T6C9A9_9BACL|nr:DNA primase [Melghirimyces profundicolus]PTX64881.1 DNA primase [Melghirimyces profundicolus]
MRGRIPDEVIDRVREHFDIVDVVGQSVRLKRSGRNFFGLCPFHSERTPSFSVSPEKQIYYCFGCGAGGDVFKFLMETEQLSFVEAVVQLAEEAGVEVPGQEEDVHDPEEARKRKLREVTDLAARVYHHLLMETEHGEAARRYLKERGITPETMVEFQLGYAPDSYHFLRSFLKRRNYDEVLAEEAGLLARRESGRGSGSRFDRFRNRVIFPIHDTQGRVIGFGGRLLGEGQPKYLNSPETALFHKGKFLFNLHRARKAIRSADQAVLFEGYMDVISAWQAGIKNGLANLGTSLTEAQARVIRRNAETAVLCYDSDPAGQNAAERAMEMIREQGCVVKVAQMPPGMDPDDYIRQRGGPAFSGEVIAQALPYVSFKLEVLKEGFDLKDEEGRMRYLTRAVEVIAGLPRAIERDHYLRRLAEEFHLSLDALKQEHRRIASKKKKETDGDKGMGKWNNGYHGGKHMVGRQRRPLAHEEAEKRLLVAMMHDRQVAERVRETVGAGFNVEIYGALAAYLYAYYAEGHPADPGRFIRCLKDDRLLEEASGLVILDAPAEVTEEEVADYIRHILNYPLFKEIELKKEQVRQAERAGDIAKAARLGIELMRLREQVQKEA